MKKDRKHNNYIMKHPHIDNKNDKSKVLKVFTAFCGYDSQQMALDKLHGTYPNCQFDLIGCCDIDPAACKVHETLYPSVRNYGDISKIDWDTVEDFDVFTYSFCCQDISLSGKKQGFMPGSNTRSSLLWECLKAIDARRPKYLLLENVKNLTNESFFPQFIMWQRELDARGYVSAWKVINSGDFDVPQNRERTYMISILPDAGDPHPLYYFPDNLSPTKTANDLLDETVGEECYLDDSKVAQFVGYVSSDSHMTIPVKKSSNKGDRLIRQIITPMTVNGLIPTLMASGYNQKYPRYLYSTGNFPRTGVIEIWKAKTSCEISTVESNPPTFHTKKGVVNSNAKVILAALKSLKPNEYVRLRVLSTQESLRYMGVSEKDIGIMHKSGVLAKDLYKMAGNSIVVDVLFHIFRSLFYPKKTHAKPCNTSEPDLLRKTHLADRRKRGKTKSRTSLGSHRTRRTYASKAMVFDKTYGLSKESP